MCPAGTYLLEPTAAARPCLPCPLEAFCFGGNKMAPRAGHWRANLNSTDFLHCLNHDACLAGSIEHPLGVCAPLYEGPLCAQCARDNYQNGASHVCEDCYDNDLQVRFICMTIFMGIVVGGIVSFVVHSNALIEIRP